MSQECHEIETSAYWNLSLVEEPAVLLTLTPFCQQLTEIEAPTTHSACGIEYLGHSLSESANLQAGLRAWRHDFLANSANQRTEVCRYSAGYRSAVGSLLAQVVFLRVGPEMWSSCGLALRCGVSDGRVWPDMGTLAHAAATQDNSRRCPDN